MRNAAPNYPLRRRVSAGLFYAVIGVAVWHFAISPLTNPAGNNTRAQQLNAAGMPSASSSLEAVQTEAVSMLARSGTLDGFTPSDPAVLVAAHGRDAVFAAVVDSTCFVAGMVNGRPTPVASDPTGASCTPTEIVKASADLKRSDGAAAQNRQRTADDLMRQADEMLSRWNNGK